MCIVNKYAIIVMRQIYVTVKLTAYVNVIVYFIAQYLRYIYIFTNSLEEEYSYNFSIQISSH